MTTPADSTNWPQRLSSEAVIGKVLDHMDDLVAVVDLRGQRLYNSPSYRKLFGDPARLGGTDSFAEVHPEDRARLKETFARVVASGVGARAEFRFLLAGAHVRYIESQSDLIRDAQGRPECVVIVSRDITERKQAEMQLLQAERLASLGQMAAGMAHELKNPLAVIMGSAEALKLNAPEFDRDELIGQITESTKRANELILRTLDFSRPSTLTLTPKPLAPLVRAALDMIRQQVFRQMSGVTVVTEVPAELPPALIDENTLLQVFINLGVNAVHAMPKGGTLRIRAGAATIPPSEADDAFQPNEPAVWCELSDTGSGIPPDLLDKIFEPFFTTKPVGEGSGLGLPIVRTIIKQHRGRLTVESAVGRGTTFRLLLHADASK